MNSLSWSNFNNLLSYVENIIVKKNIIIPTIRIYYELTNSWIVKNNYIYKWKTLQNYSCLRALIHHWAIHDKNSYVLTLILVSTKPNSHKYTCNTINATNIGRIYSIFPFETWPHWQMLNIFLFMHILMWFRYMIIVPKIAQKLERSNIFLIYFFRCKRFPAATWLIGIGIY